MEKGIDRILAYRHLFMGKRIGLITSISGVNNKLVSTIEILHKEFHLVALYSPEHGVRGDKEAGSIVDEYVDEATGVTVYSLYRRNGKGLTKEMLDSVDVVVYDIQDLGVRYYTFISTMISGLRECKRYGKEYIILDRPNPLGGIRMEGSVLQREYTSFVGYYPLATRYGLTIGELAILVNEEEQIGCSLTVIPCSGWKREMLYPETKQIFVMPSLGIPRFETALLYTGTCLVEGTNLSEGRGTSAPFELIGAPYVDETRLIRRMREHKLEGVQFSPAYFKPTTAKYQGELCKGIHIHITDIHHYESYKTGLYLLASIRDLHPKEFQILAPHKENQKPFISLLNGNDDLEQEDFDIDRILSKNKNELETFRVRKEQYHIYE